MAIDPTAYGVVYGVVSDQQKLDNATAMAAAVDAAILAGDSIQEPPAGTVFQVSLVPTTSQAKASQAPCCLPITRSGLVDIRGVAGTGAVEDITGVPAPDTVWDVYLDYSSYDGTAPTATKVFRAWELEDVTPKVDETGVTVSLEQLGGGSCRARFSAALGSLAVDDSIFLYGWPSSANNTLPQAGLAPAERFIVTAVGTDGTGNYVDFFASRVVTETGDADSRIVIASIFDQVFVGLFRPNIADVQFNISDIEFAGPTSIDGYEDIATMQIISHIVSTALVTATTWEDYGQNDWNITRVKATGEWPGPFAQVRGGAIITFSNCHLIGSSTVASMHGHKPMPSPNRTCRVFSSIIESIPIPSGLASDGNARGSGLYIGPNCGVWVEDSEFRNMIGTGSRQYASNSSYAEYGAISPMESLYRNVTFTNTHARLVGIAAGGRAIITTDAPVTTTIQNCNILVGVATTAGSIMPRCSVVNIYGDSLDRSDSLFEGQIISAVDVTSDHQVATEINISNVTINKDGTAPVIGGLNEDRAGRVITLANVHGTFTGINAATPGILFESVRPAVGEYPAEELHIGGDCSFTASDATAGGELMRIDAGGAIRVGDITVSGSFKQAFKFRTSSPIDFEFTGPDGPDLSGITSSQGIDIEFIPPANSIRGPVGVAYDAGTYGGVLVRSDSLPQGLRLRASTDPVTRTAASGILKLSMSHDTATVTGTVTNLYLGLGNDTGVNAQWQFTALAFEGEVINLVAGAALVCDGGGNVNWQETGPREPGETLRLIVTEGGWRELRRGGDDVVYYIASFARRTGGFFQKRTGQFVGRRY